MDTLVVSMDSLIESEAKVDSVRVRSGVTQGAYRIAPAP